ncbi:hypothetical protein ABZ595_10995 [Streptomyces rubradiris]
MPEGIHDADGVGSASAKRYTETVAVLRKLAGTTSRIRFRVGG